VATSSIVNQVSCNGGNNGSAIVNPLGGTPPYSYSWNTSPTQTTQIATGLPAGNYIATVTDAKNCNITTSAVSISQPPALTVTASPSALVSCSTAISISASASGGTGSYVFLWSNGNTGPSISVYTGSYTVTVTDNAGCTAVTSVSIQAASNSLAATINQPSNICYGSSTTVSVVASGGFGGYTYLWDNGATSTSINAPAGSHCVNVTDAGGCITSACVNVNQNQPLSAGIILPPLICPMGTTTLQAYVTGGQAPYSYLWNNGVTTSSLVSSAGTRTVIVYDALGAGCSSSATVTVIEETPITIFTGTTNVSCYGGNNGTASLYVNGGVPGYSYLWSVGGATTSIIGNLSAGNYSVQVTDNIGCKKSVSMHVSQPSTSLTVIASSTNVACYADFTGLLYSAAMGGIGSPYYYYWDPVGASTATLTGLPAGTYSVIVADSTGCYATATTVISEPSAISIMTNTLASTCSQSNGSATITPSGGGGVYTYTWSPGGSNNSSISNVFAGTYTASVKDNNGCLNQIFVTIPHVGSTASPGFNVSTACPKTPSAFTDLSVRGNDSILSWSWDFNDPLSGSNNFSLLQNPSHVYTAGGNYFPILTIRTQIGCIQSFSLQVPFHPEPEPDFLLHSVCVNSSISFTNTSFISASSITNYNWDFGDPMSGTNNTSTVLNPVHYYSTPGVYTTTLTTITNNGCSSSVTHTMDVYPAPTASFTSSNGCQNSSSVFTNQSSGSIRWFWNFGDGSSIDSVYYSPAHTYTSSGYYPISLTAISNHNCTSTTTLGVAIYPAPIANFSAPIVCLHRPTYFTDISSVSSGSLTSWAWDFGDFSALTSVQNPTYTYGNAGVFVVNYSVTSSSGCLSVITKTVGVYALPVANFTTTNACLNALTQFTDLSTTGLGTSIQSWLWAFGDGSPITNTQNPTHTYPATGVFNPILVVTNNFGCKDTVRHNLTIQPNPIVSFAVSDTSGCATFCPTFTDTSTPTGLLTSWQWDFGDNTTINNTQNPTHCFTEQGGTYTITLKGYTANGCFGSSNQNTRITIYQDPVASFNYAPSQISSSSPEIYLTNTSLNATSWSWDLGDGFLVHNTTENNLVHSYENAGDYCVYLKVFNDLGCSDFAKHCFNIEPDFTFYVPNAFTPGSTKGVNDFFTGYGINISKFEMWIFDRWGEKIYYTDDIYKGWDGKAKGGADVAKQDVYTYKINVYDLSDNLHKYIGHVTLLR
jgi:gliding motility-associated-like protein